MSFSSAERAKMVALFHDLGPDAPTLCEGWTTRDLAAHLWVRENRLDASAGLFVPALSSRLEKATEEALKHDFDELVDDWGRGAGKLNPFRYADKLVNSAEHFVHHEDIRRANGRTEAREFSHAAQKELLLSLKTMGAGLLSKSRRPVVLEPVGFPPIVAADKHGVAEQGDDIVRVRGTVSEILLWAFGRDAAHVKIVGDKSAITRSSL